MTTTGNDDGNDAPDRGGDESPLSGSPAATGQPGGASGEGDRGEFRFGLHVGRDAGGRQEMVIRPGLPVAGAFALVFGILALFRLPLLLGPLAMIAGAIAMLRGDRGAGLIGLALGIAGLLTAGTFWTLVGLGWLWTEFF